MPDLFNEPDLFIKSNLMEKFYSLPLLRDFFLRVIELCIKKQPLHFAEAVY